MNGSGSNSFAIAGFVLGCIALVFVCVPFISIPVMVLGFILAIVGLIVGIQHNSGLGFAIAALVINGVVAIPLFLFGMAIGTAGIFGAADAVREAAEHAEERDSGNGSSADDAENGAPQAPTPPVVPPQASSPPVGSPTGTKDSRTSGALPWREPFQMGNARLEIVSARIGPVELKGVMVDRYTTDKDYLEIRIRVTNTSTTKRLSFRSWQGRDLAVFDSFASLRDEYDNVLRRIDFGLGTDPVGYVESDLINPGESLIDILVFEPPIPQAHTLFLKLPGANVDADGEERTLRIPIAELPTASPGQPPDSPTGPAPDASGTADDHEPPAPPPQAPPASPPSDEATGTGQPSGGEYRTWTDASGRFSIEARFEKAAMGKVYLRTKEDQLIAVEVDKLSEVDRRWLEEHRGP
ncbi:MAG: hypothetical protein D6741_11745 [Planctomycetota bacterium]|nr:MAG: hypothetical protein D6741_11745 [Planctomycetota bacterium]